VFATTSRYDGLITTELERLTDLGGKLEVAPRAKLPERVHLALRRKQELRYGENPHQAGGFVCARRTAPGRISCGEATAGQRALYNNYVDLEAARSLVAEFERASGGDHKHNNPLRRGGAEIAAGCLREGVRL